jgi:UDP-N-acetylmuramate: L-alanyl-gamma-D-glutamyl-meso-diaminopimelate ligase
MLEGLGVSVCQGYKPENLRPHPDRVVVGNALSRGNPEVEYTLNAGLHYVSMPEVLKEQFIRGKHSVVVAGTHGKTTTTSLMAWALEVGGLTPAFLIGGLAENFGSSFRLTKSRYFVIEGDEYDTAFFDKGPKFMHYLPETVILNSVEFDHADIYPDLEAVRTAFRRLINLIPSKGRLIADCDSLVVRGLAASALCSVESFGLSPDARWRGVDIEMSEAGTRFSVLFNGERFGEFSTPLIGDFNLRNCLAVIAVAHGLGIEREAIAQALSTFKSVKRRMEVRGEVNGIVVIDDFAHHPTAVKATLVALKGMYPGRRLIAVFEPRSRTSRLKIMQAAYEKAFREADYTVIAPLFRPEVVPDHERLSPDEIVLTLRSQGGEAFALSSVAEILDHLATSLRPSDVVVIMSNGGFGGIHAKLLERLK